MTTVADLKKIIQSHIDRELPAIEVHDIIAGIIKEKWEGKPINKRLANQLKEKLTALYGKEPVVFYEPGYLYYVKVWGTPAWPTYNEQHQFFLGHANSQNTAALSSEEFHNRTDACHG